MTFQSKIPEKCKIKFLPFNSVWHKSTSYKEPWIWALEKSCNRINFKALIIIITTRLPKKILVVAMLVVNWLIMKIIPMYTTEFISLSLSLYLLPISNYTNIIEKYKDSYKPLIKSVKN